MRRWKAAFGATKARAKWIGMATHAAGNHPQFPFRDSEASRWKAVAAQRKRAERKAGIDGRRKKGAKPAIKVIPTAKGGHTIELALSGHCWLCTRCKTRSTSWVNLATSKCSGAGAKPLTTIAATMDCNPVVGDRRHILIESGTVQWCDTCGTYAESRTSQRMMNVCPGPPPAAARKGGMRQQLMALKAGRHPVTGIRLPAPSSNSALGSGTYALLKPSPSVDSSFVPYEPLVEKMASPSGISAERKRWLMKGRLLCKIGKEAALLRRRRRKEAKVEVREVIK